jgi:hypothetical protein
MLKEKKSDPTENIRPIKQEWGKSIETIESVDEDDDEDDYHFIW